MHKHIEVHIVEAKEVKDTDTIGKGDPYLQFWFDDSATKYKTDARCGTITPVWDVKYKIKYENQKTINFLLFDDDIGKDEIVGKTIFSLSEFENADDKRYIDKWHDMLGKDGNVSGKVRIVLELLD